MAIPGLAAAIRRLGGLGQEPTLARRFMLASAVILAAGIAGIGWWVGKQIEQGVIHQTAATTALYVDSVVAPQVQELAQRETLSPQRVSALDALLRATPLGHEIVSIKIWDGRGRLAYATEPAAIGRAFVGHERLTRAWRGEVTTQISGLGEDEHVF